MVKGRGWVPLGDRVGRFFGASSARAPAFSVALNKADLFTAIQRCKLLFIKVSHSVSSEQNENAGSLARTVSNAPSVLCPLSVFVTGSSQTNSQVSTHMHSHTHYTVTFTHTHWASTIKLSQTHRHTDTHPSRPSLLSTGCVLIQYPNGRLTMSPASNQAGQQPSKTSLPEGYLDPDQPHPEAPTGKGETCVCVGKADKEKRQFHRYMCIYICPRRCL